MHERTAAQAGMAKLKARVIALRHPDGKVAVAVGLIGKLAQAAQVKAVALLQRFYICIGKRCFQHRGNADGAACGRAHPNGVVIAPLNIHIVMLHQGIHNTVGAGAAVIQIAHDVQLIHGQALDQLAEMNDKRIGLAVFDDADDDLIIIHLFVMVFKMGVQQFVQNMCALWRQAAAHMGAGVLAADQAAKLDQAQQGVLVPVIQVFFALGCLEQRQLLLGVIDQGGKLLAVFGAGVFLRQHSIDLFADHARGAVEHMHERLVFAVQIAHKMLGALGQAQHGLLVDHLAGCLGHGGVFLRKQLQITQIFLDQLLFFTCKLHEKPPISLKSRYDKPLFVFRPAFLPAGSTEKSIIFSLTIGHLFCLVNSNFGLFLRGGIWYTL